MCDTTRASNPLNQSRAQYRVEIGRQDTRSVIGHRLGNRQAQATGRTRDERDLPLEVEQR